MSDDEDSKADEIEYVDKQTYQRLCPSAEFFDVDARALSIRTSDNKRVNGSITVDALERTIAKIREIRDENQCHKLAPIDSTKVEEPDYDKILKEAKERALGKTKDACGATFFGDAVSLTNLPNVPCSNKGPER